MITKNLIGQRMRHTDFGTVVVNHFLEGSRTIVDVTVVDRGPGYDSEMQQYRRMRNVTENFDESGNEVGKSLNWIDGRNPEYGHQDQVHIKSLTEINEYETIHSRSAS